MKSLLLLSLMFGIISAVAQTNIFPSSGNVGIGSLTPTEKLEVVVNDLSLGQTAGNYIPLTRIRSNARENNVLINDYILRETDGVDWTSASYIRGLSIDVSYLSPITLRSWIKQNPINEKIEFGSSGKTFLSVGSEVGIGTTTPLANLHVAGTTTINGDLV